MPVWLAVVVLAGVSACGGVVETRDPIPDPTGSGGGAGASNAGGGSAGSLGGPTVDLPECKKGRPVDSSGDTFPNCPYLHDSRCYDTKLDACACACAKLRDSTCSSGFPEPDGTTRVSCF